MSLHDFALNDLAPYTVQRFQAQLIAEHVAAQRAKA